MPAIHDPAAEEGGGLLRSAELRVVVAVAVAAGALLLALLAVAAERTDFLLLDFREWRSETDPVYLENLQSAPPDRRPFRLTLRLDPAAGKLHSLAAEREFPAGEGERYCFQVLASPEVPVKAAGLSIAVFVNDAVAWSAPLAGGSWRGQLISLAGIRPRQGKVKIGLELRSSPGQPLPASTAPAVHFEYASLRDCEDQGER